MTLFDIHTHGIGGFDTRTTDPADILAMAEIHGSHGVDAILAAIYPAPLDIMRANLEAVKEAMGQQGGIGEPVSRREGDGEQGKPEAEKPRTGEPVSRREEGERKRLAPGRGSGSSANWREGDGENGRMREKRRPARILGVYLEGPFLNPLRAGALDGSSFLAPSAYHLDRLLDGFEDIIKVVTVAPELPGALALIRSLGDRGIRASMGHADATFAEAEEGFHAGATGVTHIFNAMRPWHHREPGLAGFGLTNPHIYVEVIADPYHLHESVLRLIFSAKSPERLLLVSDSVRKTGMTKGEDGVRDERGGLAGGSMALPEAADRVLRLGCHPELVKNVISVNQWRYITL